MLLPAGTPKSDKNPAPENNDKDFGIHPLFSDEFLRCMVVREPEGVRPRYRMVNNTELRQVLLKKGQPEDKLPVGEPEDWVMSHPVVLNDDSFSLKRQLVPDSLKLWKEITARAEWKLKPEGLASYINNTIRRDHLIRARKEYDAANPSLFLGRDQEASI